MQIQQTIFPLPQELNAMETIASKGGRIDPGGYRWPPTFSNWLKTVFWQFWQFTIFSSFNFRGHFEGLNEYFSDQASQ
jgi:hypothetical protein